MLVGLSVFWESVDLTLDIVLILIIGLLSLSSVDVFVSTLWRDETQ